MTAIQGRRFLCRSDAQMRIAYRKKCTNLVCIVTLNKSEPPNDVFQVSHLECQTTRTIPRGHGPCLSNIPRDCQFTVASLLAIIVLLPNRRSGVVRLPGAVDRCKMICATLGIDRRGGSLGQRRRYVRGAPTIGSGSGMRKLIFGCRISPLAAYLGVSAARKGAHRTLFCT